MLLFKHDVVKVVHKKVHFLGPDLNFLSRVNLIGHEGKILRQQIAITSMANIVLQKIAL